MKRWIVLTVFLIGCVAAYQAIGDYLTKPISLKLGEGTYETRVARTSSEIEQGLSGTSPLLKNQALLFDFPNEALWGIWMKGMSYPIDIVWLDANKKVIYIVTDAQPSSYPSTTYQPDEAARYVIEFKAGTVRDAHITIGAQAVF